MTSADKPETGGLQNHDDLEQLQNIIGLGKFSARKSYYPELQEKIEELKEERNKYERIFSDALSGIFQAELNGGIIVANPAMVKLCGYNSPDQFSSISDIGEQLFADPAEKDRLIKALRHEGVEPGFETKFIRSDGKIIDVSLIASIQTSVGGEYLECFVQDITERKRAEEALQQSEEKYRRVVETSPDAIVVTDLEGKVIYANQEFARLHGLDAPETWYGKQALELIAPKDREKTLHVIKQMIETGLVTNLEFTFLKKDGGRFPAEVSGNAIRKEDGTPQSLVILARDITERKQLEEQLQLAQKMEAVGQLTAGIAHDFNNLLTAINGFAELIQLQLSPNDPLREMVGKISASSQRAANLVHQLMVFSRKQIIEPKVLNLNEVVNQIDKMLRRIIGEHIDLKTTLSPELWPVKVDATQLEQVIVNLAVNARDAMPDGGKLIIETANIVLDENYVADHFQAEPGNYVLLAVSDTGVGISREVQARIFEPFFSTKEMGQGTGLGLATVYGIVKQHGGDIRVYSEEGQGTVFKIYLPRAEEALAPPSHMETSAKLPAGRETILLVEDAEGVRNLASRVLQMQGYTVLDAHDGREALRLAAHYTAPIHLLLTDVVLPDINGKALANQLRQSRPQLKILYMSGYTDNAIAHHGVLDPNVAFLQKPFNPIALAQKIRQVLDSPAG